MYIYIHVYLYTYFYVLKNIYTKIIYIKICHDQMQKKCKNTLRANCPAKLMGPQQVQGGDAPGKDCHEQIDASSIHCNLWGWASMITGCDLLSLFALRRSRWQALVYMQKKGETRPSPLAKPSSYPTKISLAVAWLPGPSAVPHPVPCSASSRSSSGTSPSQA